MSKSFKFLAITGFVALLAACGNGQQEEFVVVIEPEPISVEPTYTGKLK